MPIIDGWGFNLATPSLAHFLSPSVANSVPISVSLLLNFEINTDKLDERAEETRQMIAKAQQMEQDLINKANAGTADDLRYIG